MEASPYPTLVLQVNINCCKACPRKLKKLMQKLSGVDSVEVDVEKRLVYVKGKIDPEALIKVIKSKMNKIATLVPSNQAENDKNKNVLDEKPNQVENEKNRSAQYGDGSKNDGCYDDKGEGGGHREEAYRGGVWGYNRMDDGICRDKYCLIHKENSIMKNGPIFPQRGYDYGMPPPTVGYGGGRMLPVPPAFGYGLPPPTVGIGGGRIPPVPPTFGYGYSVNDFSGEGSNRDACTIM